MELSGFSAARHLQQRADEITRIKTERGRDVEQFDQVDTALSRLKVRHEGLMTPQLLGELALLQPRLLAIGDEELGQASVAGRSQRAGHTAPGRKEPAG